VTDIPVWRDVTQVSDQWRAAAIKAGIPANDIGIYTGKDGVLPNATRSAGTAKRYTLTTIHRLQADAKRGTASVAEHFVAF
jgi:hypothetical protein